MQMAKVPDERMTCGFDTKVLWERGLMRAQTRGAQVKELSEPPTLGSVLRFELFPHGPSHSEPHAQYVTEFF